MNTDKVAQITVTRFIFSPEIKNTMSSIKKSIGCGMHDDLLKGLSLKIGMERVIHKRNPPNSGQASFARTAPFGYYLVSKTGAN